MPRLPAITENSDAECRTPLAALAQSSTPVLLIHGTADVNILPLNSERLLHANESHVTIWEVQGAVRCGAYSTAHSEFERKVLGRFGQFPFRRSDPDQLL